MKRTALDIYQYTDYRDYLKDRLAELKAQDRKYSLRFLAKKLGLSSNSHLKMVMDGDHNLSLELGRKLADFLNLRKQETDFFLILVRYCQAKTTRDKTEALEDLRRVSQFVKIHRLALDQFDYYNDPLTLVLREMVVLPGFQEDPAWIAQYLPFKATAKEVREAIDKLLRQGLLVRNGNGRLKVTESHITTGDGFGAVTLKGYYQNAFNGALEALDLSSDKRHLGGMSMAVSEETYEKIVDHFKDFLNTVRAEVDADHQPRRVYQLVMGCFPLTKEVLPNGE